MSDISPPSDVDGPPTPPTDDKDWTWVLRQPCPECGFDAATISGPDVPGIVIDAAGRYQRALSRPDARQRPDELTWSVLEYGCHIRDVFVIFAGRAQSMLDQDDPLFANWDQDETAVRERYHAQDPQVVAAELGPAAERAAGVFASVTASQWGRAGRRSNGSTFTVQTLAQYFAHDVVHHLRDIDA